MRGDGNIILLRDVQILDAPLKRNIVKLNFYYKNIAMGKLYYFYNNYKHKLSNDIYYYIGRLM